MSTEQNQVLGKVAQILNEREVAINLGKRDGVTQGMKFSILAQTPQLIYDPDTNELLDEIDRVKVEVEAKEVRARITICSTFKKTLIPGIGFSAALTLSQLAGAAGPREVVETLRIEDAALPPPLDPEESYVKIGDRVVGYIPRQSSRKQSQPE